MRKYSWLYYKIRSTKLFYLYRFILIKKRLPKLFNKHYSDYVFFDNLFDRHSKNFILADKVEVRKILKKRNLKHILPQLYFVYSSAEEIDFDVLPNRFALKCNHGAGFNIICNDKSKLSLQDTKNKLDEWLKKSHPIPFEGHYRRIKPKILAEQYLGNSNGDFPSDYKFHCANGEPYFIQVCTNRTDKSEGYRFFYDTDWNKLDFVQDSHVSPETKEVEKPLDKSLDKMISYSRILSKNLEYCRVDFYLIDNKIIFFSEITLTPTSGWFDQYKENFNIEMGKRIKNNK